MQASSSMDAELAGAAAAGGGAASQSSAAAALHCSFSTTSSLVLPVTETAESEAAAAPHHLSRHIQLLLDSQQIPYPPPLEAPLPPSDDLTPIPSPLPHAPPSPPRSPINSRLPPPPVAVAVAAGPAASTSSVSSSSSPPPPPVSSSSSSSSSSSTSSTATSASFSSSSHHPSVATASVADSAAATAGEEEEEDPAAADDFFRVAADDSSSSSSESAAVVEDPSSPTTTSLAAASYSITPPNVVHTRSSQLLRSPSSSSSSVSFLSAASNSPFCSPLQQQQQQQQATSSPSSFNPFLSCTPPSASYVTASNTPLKLTPASSQRYPPAAAAAPPQASTSHQHGATEQPRSPFVPEITPVVEVPFPGPPSAHPADPAPAAVSSQLLLKTPMKKKSPQKKRSTFPQSLSPRRGGGGGGALAMSSSSSLSLAHPPPPSRSSSCDVYISVYGCLDPGLLRFSKWMRAELELQGVACFVADRSLYSEQRSHDIAMRIMNSATFGIVIISRKLFRNPFSIQEIRTFLERKNLVPVFFDLSPADCVVSDIVERRGRIWEHEGGELWKLYEGGQEREWKDVVESLVRVDDCWRLEAFSGNWRDCIQRAVALLGSRLGRRSSAAFSWDHRERVRWQQQQQQQQAERVVDLEELPFPRNPDFIGREKELQTLESLLFSKSSSEDVDNKEDSNEKIAAAGASSSAAASSSSSRRARPNLVCITGVAGIGKTELALEYAYTHLQKYRMVLWVGGEARYLRQNYHNLSLFLGVDVSTDTQLGPEPRGGGGGGRGLRSLEELEADAVEKVKRELQRDVPYLLIIDNLEMEKDWWDGHPVSELLPRVGCASHVIITTRRRRQILDLEQQQQREAPQQQAPFFFPYLVLSCLSGAEALTLMKGGKPEQHFPLREYDKLKELEDRLARLTLGLSIIGKILVEFHMRPTELLELINKVKEEIPVATRDRHGDGGDDDNEEKEDQQEEDDEDNDDAILRRNPFLVRLLHVCFTLLDGGTSSSEGEKKNLATRMAWVGGWFAPYAIPYSLLASAASKLYEDSSSSGGGGSSGRRRFRGKGVGGGVTKMFLCCVAPNSSSRRMEAEAGAHLIKCNIARRSMQEGCIYFHAIVQTYARKQGGELAARAAVQAVRKGGNLMLHYDHFWAASFLVFRFGNRAPPVMVDLRVTDLLLFTKKVVLPLALRAFTNFSHCNAALELLRQCNSVFEEMEKSFVSQVQDWWDKSLCWMRGGYEGHQVDEYAWQELTLLKAVLLETQAKLLMKGGQFDRGEEVCRTCLNIRSVMLGPDHVDTIAAQETLAKLVRYRNTM